MPKYERDIHDPDDVRVFDGGGDDDDDGGSHLPVVIVISLLVLVAFGGVVWLAYNNGVARGRADVPAAMTAQNAPSEQPATAPGSGVAPGKQIKIYQQQAGSEDDEPVDRPAASPPAPSPALALRAQPAVPKPEVKAPPTLQAASPKPTPVTQAAPQPAAPALKLATQPPAKLGVAVPPKAADGAYLLQIGAYKSQSDADAAWKVYKTKHAGLLSGLGPDVQKADLGDKGVWYRLRVGSFADKDAAAAMCDRLKADGAACFPAK